MFVLRGFGCSVVLHGLGRTILARKGLSGQIRRARGCRNGGCGSRASEHTSMTAQVPEDGNRKFNGGDAPVGISSADMRTVDRV